MSKRLWRLSFVVCAGVGFGTGCTAPGPTAPANSPVGGPRYAAGVPGTDCVEGCLEQDPDPAAAGYFIPGTLYKPEGCASGNGDWDEDGLNDNCEYTLALTFAPEMSYQGADDLNREPRWSARWTDDDPDNQSVDIMYLQSYWMDMGDYGTSSVTCSAIGFTLDGGCNGHLGDSEWIQLRVKYNSDLKHWILIGAWSSVHETTMDNIYIAADTVIALRMAALQYDIPALLEVPDKKGGFPRFYAADGKHGNYPTNAYCDAHGGILPTGINSGSDNCDGYRYTTRLEVPFTGNVGSSSHNLINCVPTARTDHPVYSAGYQVCYWSGSSFGGWFNAAGAGTSAAYGPKLVARGF